jgi:hypothetical protein
MLPSISAAAARALGYRGFADLIEAEAEQFTPQRIARLFGCSASRTAGRDCAVVLTGRRLRAAGGLPSGLER